MDLTRQQQQSKPPISTDKIVREGIHKCVQHLITERSKTTSRIISGGSGMESLKEQKWFELPTKDDMQLRRQVAHSICIAPHYLLELDFLLPIEEQNIKRSILLEHWTFQCHDTATPSTDLDCGSKMVYTQMIQLIQQLVLHAAQLPAYQVRRNHSILLQYQLGSSSTEIFTATPREYSFESIHTFHNRQFTIQVQYLDWQECNRWLPFVTLLGSLLISDFYSDSDSNHRPSTVLRTEPIPIIHTLPPPALTNTTNTAVVLQQQHHSYSPLSYTPPSAILSFRGSLSPIHINNNNIPPFLSIQKSQSSSGSGQSKSSSSTSASTAHTPPVHSASTVIMENTALNQCRAFLDHAPHIPPPRVLTILEREQIKTHITQLLQQIQ